MFNAGLKSPELGAAAAAAARRKSQAPDLRGEVGERRERKGEREPAAGAGVWRRESRRAGSGSAELPLPTGFLFFQLRVGLPLCPPSPGETGLCGWIVPEQRHGPPSPSSAGPSQLPAPRILHDTLPASRVCPGRVDPPQPSALRQPRLICSPPQDSVTSWQTWMGPSFIPAHGSLGSAWEPGTGLEAEPCAGIWDQGGLVERGWGQAGSGTRCDTPGARGSRDKAGRASLSRDSLVIPGQPHYPGGTSLSQHSPLLFLHRSQWRRRGGEKCEWDHAGTPRQRRAGGDPLSLTPQKRGAPPLFPLKIAAPLALPPPPGFPWLSPLTPPNLSILTREH